MPETKAIAPITTATTPAKIGVWVAWPKAPPVAAASRPSTE